MISFKVGDTKLDLERDLGDQIRRLRHERDMTQEELGVKAELSRSTINHIERSPRDPKYSTVKKILLALK